MWSQSFSRVYTNISKEQIWAAWSDVNHWPRWDKGLDYCDMKDSFTEGTKFILKPKGGPKVKIFISKIIPYQEFSDYCRFPGAKMFDEHFLEESPEGLKITNKITVKGPLSFLWVKLVAKNVAQGAPEQTESLVEYARKLHV